MDYYSWVFDDMYLYLTYTLSIQSHAYNHVGTQSIMVIKEHIYRVVDIENTCISM